MITKIALDDSLVREAVRVGGHRTKASAVTHALEEYIQRRKQRAILDLFGKIEMQSDVAMKRQRVAAPAVKPTRMIKTLNAS